MKGDFCAAHSMYVLLISWGCLIQFSSLFACLLVFFWNIIWRVLIKIALFFVQHLKESTQQGDFESKYRDTMVMFSNWPFTPMSLENPFEIPVHIYQGTEDYLVPVALQRCVARSLPWVTYHELPGYGHFLNAYPGFADDLVQTLFQDSRQSLVS